MRNNEGLNEKRRKKIKLIRNICIILVSLAIIAVILKLAPDYMRDEITDRTNLIINNNNVTSSLRHDIYIDEKNIIYIAKEDIDNFFDRYIYYDKKNNQIITTYDTKIASIKLGENEINLNGKDIDISGTAIKKDDTIYLPFSEMCSVYNIELEYIKDQDTVTVDSLDRELINSYISKKTNVKYKKRVLSRTVDKLDKGEVVVVVSTYEDGWAKVRTTRGKIGYIKQSNLGNTVQVRSKTEDKKVIEGKVNLIWDYYSEYVTAPNRTGSTIEGVNVVSPSFFSLVKLGQGDIIDNVGEEGKQYIEWAKDNDYKIWAMFSNNSMKETTSEILNNYSLRQKTIENIVDLAIKYELDGINVDFEHIYMEDKDMYSRFLIELAPRLREHGKALSVDVTAPDGAEDWSLCFDRNVIGHVSDFIIFMAYDQHGSSSTEAGTVAGHDWVEVNIKKFINQEAVPKEKIVLGIPFYTRLWKEVNGQLVESSTVDMKDVDKVIPQGIEKRWEDEVKQNYIEYSRENAVFKMWIEDIESIRAKLSLVNKYELAGVAFWEKDRETENIWSVIKEQLDI